ncbi:sirohydrochlorin chelatase [Pseudanabaena minima]|uniref:sirohydrochlorin chelatase n=1 Tax=Pseudanabaena minima TaxID=890415 RepID=UPI003DA7DD13
MNATALFLVTHGSSDRRSWLALQNFVTIARSRKNKYGDDYDNRYISGGCLEGQELNLSQQLEQFATEVIPDGVSEIVILPLFLLEGVHVSEDIPEQVAIAASKLTKKFPDKFSDRSDDRSIFRITAHVGTDNQIPSLLLQHFEKYSDESSLERQGRILIAHGSRRFGANQVVEDLATQSQAIAAYWGVEPKIETQIENFLAQGIRKINVLPYFLTEGGITEAITNKLKPYRDHIQIQQLPVPLSNEQTVDLALKLI